MEVIFTSVSARVVWNVLCQPAEVEALTTMLFEIDNCLLHDKHSLCVANDKNIYFAVMRSQWQQQSQQMGKSN